MNAQESGGSRDSRRIFHVESYLQRRQSKTVNDTTSRASKSVDPIAFAASRSRCESATAFAILARFIPECLWATVYAIIRIVTRTDFGRTGGRRAKSEGGLEEDYHEPQAAACAIPLRPDYGPRTSSCRCDLEINFQSSVCYCTGPYWSH